MARGTSAEKDAAALEVKAGGSEDPVVIRFMIDRGEFWGSEGLVGGRGSEEAVVRKIGDDYAMGRTAFARKAVEVMKGNKNVCMAALQECSLGEKIDMEEEVRRAEGATISQRRGFRGA